MRVTFPWSDAFRPSKKTSQANVHFEKAAVAFNVAAVTSQQALQVERGVGEGATQACKLFQVRGAGRREGRGGGACRNGHREHIAHNAAAAAAA